MTRLCAIRALRIRRVCNGAAELKRADSGLRLNLISSLGREASLALKLRPQIATRKTGGDEIATISTQQKRGRGILVDELHEG